MQAEGIEMYGGGQALDVVQATKGSYAAPRGPGSVICTERNTPLLVLTVSINAIDSFSLPMRSWGWKT